jgi:hypothetical protein
MGAGGHRRARKYAVGLQTEDMTTGPVCVCSVCGSPPTPSSVAGRWLCDCVYASQNDWDAIPPDVRLIFHPADRDHHP